MEITKEALARKKRFNKIKKDAGGDAHDLQRQLSEQDYQIFWDSQGEIRYFGPVSEKVLKSKFKGCKSSVFTAEQVEILKAQGTNGYIIVTDPNVETVHTIQVRPIESQFVSHEDEFLSLIEEGVKRPDISVNINKKDFTVKCSKSILNKYKDTDLATATAKGSKLLKFYFTSINDPSFMVHSLNVNLPELLENKQVKKILPIDLSQCSLYTVKIFDKYVRT